MDAKIYADCFHAVIEIFNRTQNIPKPLRPTLGRKIEEASLSCLLNIKKASLSKSNQHFLLNASTSLDELRTLLHLAQELKALNVKGFSELTFHLTTVGKQLGGLIKYGKSSS